MGFFLILKECLLGNSATGGAWNMFPVIFKKPSEKTMGLKSERTGFPSPSV